MKAARFSQDSWELLHSSPRSDDTAFWRQVLNQGARDIVFSAVYGPLPQIPLDMKARQVSVSTIPSERVDYETPESLGVDRVLAAFGAYSRFQDSCVVIDSGSATTLDYIDDLGIFRGGVIAPGYEALLAGMRLKTPSLPNSETLLPGHFPGRSTNECLQWGRLGFYQHAVLGLADRFKARFSVTCVVLSGGAVDLLHPVFPEAVSEPFLVFEGMRYCQIQDWLPS